MNKIILLFILAALLPIGASLAANAQDLTLSDVQNSSCVRSTRSRVNENEIRRTIILLKEGNILSVQLQGVVSNCATEGFDVTHSMSGGDNGEAVSVSVGVEPILPEVVTTCECPFNVSFTIYGLEANNFYFSCWWYEGQVNLTEGEPLTLESITESVGINDWYYFLDKVSHTAMLQGVMGARGDLAIPSEFEYEDQTYFVTDIFEGAFIACNALTSVTLPSTITHISDFAFSYCNNLTNVYCHAESVPETGNNVFNETPIASATLHVPAASLWKYKDALGWSDFMSIVALPEPVTFTAGQMATIILPTEPEASRGKYYRLDRVEGNEIVFEQELHPAAHVPYIIVPSEDFIIDVNTLDLEGCYRDTAFVDGISFIGSFVSEELDEPEGSCIDIIDTTPDCGISSSGETGKRAFLIGALRAYLLVSGEVRDELSIVLRDKTTSVQSIQNSKKETHSDVYDLRGRKFMDNHKLPRGIYIEGGRKVAK